MVAYTQVLSKRAWAFQSSGQVVRISKIVSSASTYSSFHRNSTAAVSSRHSEHLAELRRTETSMGSKPSRSGFSEILATKAERRGLQSAGWRHAGPGMREEA